MGSQYQRIALGGGDDASATVQIGGVYMNPGIRIADLKAIIDAPDIAPRFRISVLTPDEKDAYEIPQSDILSGGSFSENYQSGQRRSLSFSVSNASGAYSIGAKGLWADSKVSLSLGLERPDGSVIWFRRGVYAIDSVSPSLSASGERTIAFSCKDKFAILEGAKGKLETSYTIQPGASIPEAVSSLLLMGGGDGWPLDPTAPTFSPRLKNLTTQSVISHSAGDTVGAIISDLATQANAEYFYDSRGSLTFFPIEDAVLDADKPLIYDFVDENGDMGDLGFSFDLNAAINRVIVVGATVSAHVARAESVNSDASSPLCASRIGIRTAVVNDSNITNDRLAKERADYELRMQTMLKTSTTLSVAFNPLLTVNNMVTVTSDYYGLNHERFITQSVSGSLDYGGRMSIGVSSARNLPFLGK